MLRSLSLPFLAAFLVTSVSAAPLTLGIHGGGSVPNLRDNGGNEISSGWSSRLAPFFGVSAETRAFGPWSLLAEVNYCGQGGKRDGAQAVTDADLVNSFGGQPLYASFNNTAELNYVEIPVLLKYHLPGLFRPTVAAGPYVGFLTSARNRTSGSSTVYFDRAETQPVMVSDTQALVVDFTANTDAKPDLKSFNWGIQAGVGASLPYGRGAITLDLRGGLGLADVQKDSANGKNTTGALVVAIGYALPVGL